MTSSNRGVKKLRTTAKRAASAGLRPLGVRLVTAQEEQARAARHRKLLDQLCDVYEQHYFPDLRDTPGRRELLYSLLGTPIPEAMFLLHYLQQARLSGPGDIVEMGVAQGATSALIANELREDDTRSFWLYDSFEGLSRPTAEDELIDDVFDLGSMDAYTGTMAYPESTVRQRVAATGYPNDRLQVHAGFISQTSPVPETVAFAYLDFDLYEPILTGLDILAPATRPGSVLMVDDYKFLSSGPEKAVKEFLAAHDGEYELLESPREAGHFCALRRVGA